MRGECQRSKELPQNGSELRSKNRLTKSVPCAADLAGRPPDARRRRSRIPELARALGPCGQRMPWGGHTNDGAHRRPLQLHAMNQKLLADSLKL
jgi:hypothetical protein